MPDSDARSEVACGQVPWAAAGANTSRRSADVANSEAPLSGRGWGGWVAFRATQPTKVHSPPAAPIAAAGAVNASPTGAAAANAVTTHSTVSHLPRRASLATSFVNAFRSPSRSFLA